MAAHVTALPASALFWRRTGVALVQMLVQMGGVLPFARTGVPLVPHWRGCVAVFPVCIRTIPVTCTRTVPVTCTFPIAALRQHCTTVAPAQYTSTISFGGTLFFVYSLPQNVLLVRTENSRAIPQEKKFEKVLAKQIPLCIIPSYKFFDENTTFRLLCYSESGMVKADRASANRYHL
jgi:hypothetical protein